MTRLAKLAKILRQEKLDALYITNAASIQYFSNFTGSNGALFVTRSEKFLLTDFRYFLVARRVLPRDIKILDIGNGMEKQWKSLIKKHRVRRMGLEFSSTTLSAHERLKSWSAGIAFTDINTPIAEARISKDAVELRYIRRAQDITDEIFSILKKKLKTGMSELDIAWMIESLAHELGADDISFTPIIGINEHAASPHHQNTDRKLKKGDSILIDMGVRYRGYCSDMTRMLFTKTPTKKQAHIYSIVRDAQESAARMIKAGVHGRDVDAHARDIIAKAGYGERFGHSLGHGVGLEVHELPNLATPYTGILPERSVVTVEPGIYLDGDFGVRLEDMAIVTKTGHINITKSQKDLKTCTIRLK
ncbi:MAG: aminopeptidase P family protein [Patescibacteria group bacterium]